MISTGIGEVPDEISGDVLPLKLGGSVVYYEAEVSAAQGSIDMYTVVHSTPSPSICNSCVGSDRVQVSAMAHMTPEIVPACPAARNPGALARLFSGLCNPVGS